jgi:outer membrane murein-binding lipoprotein Lpp
MKKIVVLACLLLAGSASAQTMYKCQVNGKTEYSDKPCVGAEVKRIRPDAGPAADDQARAQMRLQNDRRRYLGDTEPSQGGQLTSMPPPRVADDPENEKVLVHDRSGWDRKTRKQIAAEEAAKAEGRERARLAAQQPGAIVLDSKGRTYTTIGGGLAIPTDGRGGGVPCPISETLVLCP